MTSTYRPKKFFGDSLRDKLLSASVPEPNTGCWLWLGAAATNGRGHLNWKGAYIIAARASYEEFVGSITVGHTVFQRCGTMLCINPDHLYSAVTREPRSKSYILAALSARTAVGTKENDCHVWTAGKTAAGYGEINFDGETKLAHRVAYELLVGPIPDGLLVCHRCDNPSCVNPKHFFLGSSDDNAKDMARKGRGRKSTVRGLPFGVDVTKAGKYISRVKINGKFARFGTYDSVDEAARVSADVKRSLFVE
jgi:hypothetical protein